jgi:hypothetical protein
MAHRTNLAVEPLSNLPLVSKIESLCKSMHSYFSHSPKRHLEFTKLAEIMETEGLKIVNNVKTRWISLLEPLKHILGEYKTLIVICAKMPQLRILNPKLKRPKRKLSAILTCCVMLALF